jgi:pyruvate/2-oxoglutarate dehydrogenase complex dihydrolipoamide acyltransferase (E2) component
LSVDATERLDFAERWLRDGLAVLRPSLSVMQVTVDMTQANRRLDEFRRAGARVTATHLLVHATARAFASNRQLHQFIAGNRRHRPGRIDIALSVSGEAFVSPVVVIEDADRKSPIEIAEDVARKVPQAQQADQELRAMLRRWGWLLPFGFLRRAFLRVANRSGGFRRKAAGTFQVSTVAGDWGLTSTFSTAGVLTAGQVWPRIVAVDGQPVVRPVMTLTLSSDHGVFDGRAASRLMSSVKTFLEEG